MSDAFFEAYSALEARMKIVDVITNNLANAQTAGFKRDFGEILQSEQGYDVGTYVDLSMGDLISTGNELDVAVDGNGFFVIQTPEGIRYTRTGSFALSSTGDLVTKDGMKVLSSSGAPITVGEGQIAIHDGGAVLVDGNEVATLKIVSFDDASKLQKEGLYRFSWNGTQDEVDDVPEPRVKSGHLERSNVNAVDEMVHLMSAYREFEAVQRTLRTLTTDMNTKLIEELGRLS
jgi:flagellar basal-body rod protein FlgG